MIHETNEPITLTKRKRMENERTIHANKKRYEISINLTIQGLYVKTRANNSGYRNHRVICLVVICSSFDSEQVFQWIPLIVFKKWTLDKKLN